MDFSCVQSSHPAGWCRGSYERVGCRTRDSRHRDGPVTGSRHEGGRCRQESPVRDGHDQGTRVRSGASPGSDPSAPRVSGHSPCPSPSVVRGDVVCVGIGVGRRHRLGVRRIMGYAFDTGMCRLLGTSGRRSGDVWFAARSACATRTRRWPWRATSVRRKRRSGRRDQRAGVGPEGIEPGDALRRRLLCSTGSSDSRRPKSGAPGPAEDRAGCLAGCGSRSAKPRTHTASRSICCRTSSGSSRRLRKSDHGKLPVCLPTVNSRPRKEGVGSGDLRLVGLGVQGPSSLVDGRGSGTVGVQVSGGPRMRTFRSERRATNRRAATCLLLCRPMRTDCTGTVPLSSSGLPRSESPR